MSDTNVPKTDNSAQSNDQLADPAMSHSSQSVAVTRPQQNSHLLRLPNELLLQIVQDSGLYPEDVRSVALSSSHLFNLARPEYYKIDREYKEDEWRLCSLWDRAIGRLDLPFLERCIYFDAAPRGLFDDPCPIVRREKMGQFINEIHVSFTAEVWDRAGSLQRALDIYVWLQGELKSFAEHLDPDHTGSCKMCSCHPEADPRTWIVAHFYQCYDSVMASCTRAHANECYEIIRALFVKGAQIPSKKLIFHDDLPAVDGFRDAAIALVNDEQERYWGPNDNTMTMALSLEAPPALLRLTIQMYRRKGIRVRSPFKLLEIKGVTPPEPAPLPSNKCRNCRHSEFGSSCAGFFFFNYHSSGLDCSTPQDAECFCTMPIKTELRQHLDTIYCDLFFPGGTNDVPYYRGRKRAFFWFEQYYRTIAAHWEEKVDILVRYEVITEAEQEWLLSAVWRLREVFRIGSACGFFNFQKNGKMCWEALFPSDPFPFELVERDRKTSYVPPGPYDSRPSSMRNWVLSRAEFDDDLFGFHYDDVEEEEEGGESNSEEQDSGSASDEEEASDSDAVSEPDRWVFSS